VINPDQYYKYNQISFEIGFYIAIIPLFFNGYQPVDPGPVFNCYLDNEMTYFYFGIILIWLCVFGYMITIVIKLWKLKRTEHWAFFLYPVYFMLRIVIESVDNFSMMLTEKTMPHTYEVFDETLYHLTGCVHIIIYQIVIYT